MDNMNDLINFDDIDNEIEENSSGDFDAMEKHENQFLISSAEFKKGNEQSYYVEIVFDVIGERYTNRKVWTNYYLVAKNGAENKVARAMYGKLCVAAGLDKTEMTNTLNLLQKMVSGDVIVKKGNAKGDGTFYDDSNEITNFKPIGSTTGVTMTTATEEKPVQEAKPSDNQGQVDGHQENPFG